MSDKETLKIYPRPNELNLDAETLDELDGLAALGYSHKEMAMVLGVDDKIFCKLAEDKSSAIFFYIQRAILSAKAKEELSLLQQARGGSMSAIDQINKLRRTRAFEISKLDIFGGFEDQKTYHILEDWLDNGCKSDLDVETQLYFELLNKINDLEKRYGRRNTVALLTKAPFNFTYQAASDRMDEATNLFYADRKADKKAIKRKKAEEVDEALALLRANLNTTKDFEAYAKLMNVSISLHDLDVQDPHLLDPDMYPTQEVLLTLDPKLVNLPDISRNEVAAQIERLDIPFLEKERLKEDAMINTIDIELKLHAAKEESNNNG